MPAHPAHTPATAFIDDFLLDTEFDIFDTATPWSRKPGIGKDMVLCDDIVLDDADFDDLESL